MNIPVARGMLIRHHNHLFFVEDVHERHTGKQKPTVHVKLRDAQDGHHVERTLDELGPVRDIAHTSRTLQYTFARPGTHVFMDTETFDEHELGDAMLRGFEPFLREGQEVKAMFVDGLPVALDLPPSVLLHVANTAAPEHAVGASGSVLKDAELENGLKIKVPLFVKRGDLIRVDTRERAYAGKEKES